MRILIFILVSQLFNACAFSPRSSEHFRRPQTAMSEVSDLEMLLLNEQQHISSNSSQNTISDSLRLGMQRNRVKRSLGAPAQVEVAGNPKYGNERWIYEKNVPTLDGYYTERKVIYFERGSVVGWEAQ